MSIDSDKLPQAFQPLFQAFWEAMLAGRRTPLLNITVTVRAVDMEKALTEAQRLLERSA